MSETIKIPCLPPLKMANFVCTENDPENDDDHAIDESFAFLSDNEVGVLSKCYNGVKQSTQVSTFEKCKKQCLELLGFPACMASTYVCGEG